MEQIKRPVNAHKGYHAHIYFDQDTVDPARRLYGLVAETFNNQLGRFHERPVGPHPMWSYQIIFGPDDFNVLVPWLDDNRQGLSVLVHGLSGDDYKDHTDYAYWLGDSHILNLAIFD